MRHITSDIYEALTIFDADPQQWITEDLSHPGTYCVSSADDIPQDWHWQLVSPEEVAARRDDLEDEQARLEEEHMQWQERR